jgi:hypothetical protein
MAITYPITLPSTGISAIEWRSINAVINSQSPYTFKQQIVVLGGQRWEATVTLPPQKRATAAAWAAALTSLKGVEGSMLFGHPDHATPRGTLRSTNAGNAASITGTQGDSSVTITMQTGDQDKTLLAGDFIQLGSSSSAELYQVLADKTGNGTLEIYPNLRQTYSSETLGTNNPQGVFRLSTNTVSWNIDNIARYGISFDIVEVL